MKTIVAGTRTITGHKLVEHAIKMSGFKITELVSGGCQGVDLLAEKWARRNSIPIKPFPSDWKQHGKAAGPIRNSAMAAYAEALVAVHDGKSPGTRDMINKAKRAGLKVYVFTL